MTRKPGAQTGWFKGLPAMARNSFLVFGLLSSVAAPAVAQQRAQDGDWFARNRYTAVTERAQPQFDPPPLHQGPFIVNPALKVGVLYDSNVFAQTTNEQDDIIGTLTGSVDVDSDWGRHAVGASLAATRREYSDNTKESATDFDAGLRGRLDVVQGLFFDGKATYSDRVEPRTAIASIGNAAEPVPYNFAGLNVGADWRQARLRLRGEVSQDQYSYDDVAAIGGGRIREGFRNTVDTAFRGRAAYAVTRDLAVTFDAAHIDRNGKTDAAFNRDATVDTYEIGADFELQSLIRGKVGIGYTKEDRDDPKLKAFDGVALNARVQWFPTELTTVTLRGDRSAVDPGLVNAAGALLTTAALRVDHELLRNVLLFGEVQYQKYEFQETNFSRTDNRYDYSGGATWKLNQRVRLEGGLLYQNYDISAGGTSFDRLAAFLSIRLTP